MKVFISWSGERSRLLAEALREWIPLVLHYAEPWLSEVDIEAGERWADEVAKELEASHFGIISVTRENLTSPWVLFEAGALAKSLQGSKVIPLLLDLEFKDVSGPLAQFQAKKVDSTGLRDVVQSLNKVATDPVPDERAKQLFDALWPQLEKQATGIPASSSPAKSARSQSDVLEELVATVRGLESRARDISDEGPGTSPRRGRRRIDPFVWFEMTQMLSDGPRDPIRILMLASAFRDDYPWLYEIGLEAYRSAKDGPSAEARVTLKRFRRYVETALRGPFEFDSIDPRMLRQLAVELDQLSPFESLDDPSDQRARRAPDKSR